VGKIEVSGARGPIQDSKFKIQDWENPGITAATDFMYEIPRQMETQMKVQIGALTLRKQDSKKVLWIS
jgi:hypothetical protein